MSEQKAAKYQADVERYRFELEQCQNLMKSGDCAADFHNRSTYTHRHRFVKYVNDNPEPLLADPDPANPNQWHQKGSESCSLL